MRLISCLLPILVGSVAIACQDPPAEAVDRTVPRQAIRDTTDPPPVRQYTVEHRSGPIVVDGDLEDTAWQSAPWTEAFLGIEGEQQPTPRLGTRVRMLWDDEFWYLAVELEEPDLWATIQARDSVIFLDNDFEWFVDPDGDTHRYFEFEINALGTEWDLFLPKPYRDGGQADNGWNIAGLRAAVRIHGTLNDPGDRDRGWTIEMAVPWAAFADSGHTRVPPMAGDSWRLNFSRVQWDLDVVDGGYRKRIDSTSGKPRAEHNWVWSPQGEINMHMPEMWGAMIFLDAADSGSAVLPPAPGGASVHWALRRVYYAQRSFHRLHHRWASRFEELGLTGLPAGLELRLTPDGYHASMPGPTGVRAIRADGLLWTP
ncbi:MAG: carbohydrate-binding family 9-like protein [Gemmatimonadota bacterium]|nr:carbohydrate-binding family 9-like protein [Gemmatimonadota bacterium]